MEQRSAQELIEGYLAAFASADVDRCAAYFGPEGTIDWTLGTYSGGSAIQEWHRDRFAAGFKILQIDGMETPGDTVTLDVTVTSKRLAAWRLPSLGGRVTLQLQNGKIQHAKFAMRSQVKS